MEVKLQENYLLSDFDHFEIYYIILINILNNFSLYIWWAISLSCRDTVDSRLTGRCRQGPPWSDEGMAS